MPFWALSVVLALGLAFFVMNYTNTVRWHIRAQNAADAAALTTIAADANMTNEQTMALYALAIDEYRLRAIVNSMINAANSVGGCESEYDDTGKDCDNAYDQEPEAYDKALGVYESALTYAESLSTATPPVPVAMPTGASGTPLPLPSAPANSAAPSAFSLAASNTNCWDTGTGKALFDCAFAYTANPNLEATGFGSSEYVDIVTCRTITQVSPWFFNGKTTFTAEGRSAATLRGITETLNPGTTTDPDATPGASGTSPPYQQIEDCPPDGPCNLDLGWMTTPPYVVNFAGLTVNATFYVGSLTAPVGGISVTPACKKG
jgi:Flp pilus assembly protein TadG